MAQPTRREWWFPPLPVEPELSDYWGPGATISEPPAEPTDPRPLREIPPREFTPEELERLRDDWQEKEELTGRSLRGSTRFSRDEVCRGYRRL